jgi:fumarate hydratase subunit beta
MSEEIRLTTPLDEQTVRSLRIGDKVLLSGVLYTGRDSAHKRLVELIEQGKELPIEIDGQVIYYVGPTPPKPGQVIGSAGPTTSGRMDKYAPILMERGLRGTIGKGFRSPEVKEAMKRFGAVYFGAIGGAGVSLAKKITTAEVVAYEDLGTEAIRRLTVEDFPVVVVNDTHGGDLYIDGMKEFEDLELARSLGVGV